MALSNLEHNLFDSVEFNYALLSALPTPVCIVTETFDIIFLNNPVSNSKISTFLSSKHIKNNWKLSPLDDSLLYNIVQLCRDTGEKVFRKGTLEINSSAETAIVAINAVPANIDNNNLVIITLEDLTEIEQLKGLLPICIKCNKINDKKNDTWTRIDEYIMHRSHADFSHGLCPCCAKDMMATLPPIDFE